MMRVKVTGTHRDIKILSQGRRRCLPRNEKSCISLVGSSTSHGEQPSRGESVEHTTGLLKGTQGHHYYLISGSFWSL